MSGGTVRIEFDLTQPIENKNVLLIEDIVDTGLTLKALLDYLRPKKPRILKACALLVKKGREQAAVSVDYVGFTVPNQFVVGYGMDVAGRFRNLPYLAAVSEPSTIK
jgi:hypoxanthine phosphoribosyltransferase